jgi:hypothetical protein
MPDIKDNAKSIRKIKKIIFAIPAVLTAMPVNPKNAAIMETTKSTSPHLACLPTC